MPPGFSKHARGVLHSHTLPLISLPSSPRPPFPLPWLEEACGFAKLARGILHAPSRPPSLSPSFSPSAAAASSPAAPRRRRRRQKLSTARMTKLQRKQCRPKQSVCPFVVISRSYRTPKVFCSPRPTKATPQHHAAPVAAEVARAEQLWRHDRRQGTRWRRWVYPMPSVASKRTGKLSPLKMQSVRTAVWRKEEKKDELLSSSSASVSLSSSLKITLTVLAAACTMQELKPALHHQRHRKLCQKQPLTKS